MRTVGTNTTTEITKPVTKPGYLVRMQFPSLTVCLSSREALNYQGVDYSARDIRIPTFDQVADGSSNITLVIANQDLALSTLVLVDGWAGVAVQVLKFWGTYVDGVTEVFPIFNGQGSESEMSKESVTLSANRANIDLSQVPATPRIVPPLFNSVLPAGYTIIWGNERFKLTRG